MLLPGHRCVFYYFTLIFINKSVLHKMHKIVPLGTLRTKMSSLKPIKTDILITVQFNWKIMQYLFIGFHSVGKALKCNLPDGAIFSGLAI